MHIDTTATVGLRGLAAIHIMVTSLNRYVINKYRFRE